MDSVDMENLAKNLTSLRKEWKKQMDLGTLILSQVSNSHSKLGYVKKDASYWRVLSAAPILQQRVTEKIEQELKDQRGQLEEIIMSLGSIVSSFRENAYALKEAMIKQENEAYLTQSMSTANIDGSNSSASEVLIGSDFEVEASIALKMQEVAAMYASELVAKSFVVSDLERCCSNSKHQEVVVMYISAWQTEPCISEPCIEDLTNLIKLITK